MKPTAFISLSAVFVLASAIGHGASAAPATQVSADTYAFSSPDSAGPPCGSQLLDISETGNMTRLELLNHAWMVSPDPRLTGQSTVEVTVNINNVSGHVVAQGSLVLEPGGFAGTWEADFNIHAPGGRSIDLDGLTIVQDAHINARGTGVFEGQWYFFSHGFVTTPPPHDLPVSDPDGAGGCEFLGEVWSGRILDPGTP